MCPTSGTLASGSPPSRPLATNDRVGGFSGTRKFVSAQNTLAMLHAYEFVYSHEPDSPVRRSREVSNRLADVAVIALVKEPTGIQRNRFESGKAARRTGQNRFKVAHPVYLQSVLSIAILHVHVGESRNEVDEGSGDLHIGQTPARSGVSTNDFMWKGTAAGQVGTTSS